MENAVQEAVLNSLFQNWPMLAPVIAASVAITMLKKEAKKHKGHKKTTYRQRTASASKTSQSVITEPTMAATQPIAAEVGERVRAAEEGYYNQYKQKASAEPKARPTDRNYSEELMNQGGAYIARTYLMSPYERSVYKVLEKAYGDKYYIFCQVRVVDLIQPNTKKHNNKSKEYFSLFRQLSQWHFDYVLCEKESFRIFCALELDDPSHERADRIKRDRILNQACSVAGLSLSRLKIDHKNKKIIKIEKPHQSKKEKICH